MSHRYNLAGGVLIKENHIAAVGGVTEAVSRLVASAPHVLRVECEVRSLEELTAALAAGADAILLDNFSPEAAREALQMIQGRIPVEISGGLHVGNIGSYVLEGVSILSSGALTHSVTALDLSLLVE